MKTDHQHIFSNGNQKLIPTVGAYAPSKAGLIRFSQACALEFSEYGIRVNSVCPGFTPTELLHKAIPDKEELDQIILNSACSNPCKRNGTPEDIANMVSFMASDRCTFMNSEAIVIDGGSNLG